MNCMHIKEALGYQCTPVKEGVFFLNSAFTHGYDPESLGAYVVDDGQGKLTITDDGNQLFTAQTHGVNITPRRIRKLDELLSAYQLSIKNTGEVTGTCREEEVGHFLSRYFEASIRLSDAISEMFPGAPKSFEDRVGDILNKGLTKQRITRNFTTQGSSGHQLTFPFAIDANTDHAKVIQPISTRGQDPRWSTVMQTLGKLVEFKQAHESTQAFVILEPGANAEGAAQAKAALVKYANILELSSDDLLINRLAA
ncbi:DUF1828 domain-containing protein [Vreelandella lionensis]|uniref:DUF1828 domain-containing protein n=1 Tax=Vreelandella lionensis TaxID=1144478 RepID=UPI0009F61D9A|nr:DUF1828 domain-containing protein [Halomonas lionensis]